jgi:hypothetical protein
MPKALFDEHFKYTEEALQICDQVETFLADYFKGDYSPREMAALLHGCVNIMECERVLTLDSEAKPRLW